MVSRSERGATVITLPSVVKLCKALEMTLPEFFTFELELQPLQGVNPDLQKGLDLLSSLDARGLKRAVRGLELLLSAGSSADGRPARLVAADADGLSDQEKSGATRVSSSRRRTSKRR